VNVNSCAEAESADDWKDMPVVAVLESAAGAIPQEKLQKN
jgi:hypothetical protein